MKNIPNRGKSKYNSHEAGPFFVDLKSNKEASMIVIGSIEAEGREDIWEVASEQIILGFVEWDKGFGFIQR